jgi:beta-fructofuranosidase
MIMIGWMQNPNESLLHDRSVKIFGQMTVPRELFINRGMLCQKPIRELDSYKCGRIDHHADLGPDEITLEGVHGRCLELDLRIAAKRDQDDHYSMFRMRFAKNDRYYTELRYRPGQSIITIDRGRSGLAEGASSERSFAVQSRKGSIKLKVLLDWCAERMGSIWC